MSNLVFRQPQVPFEILQSQKAGWFDWRRQDHDDHLFFVRNPDASYRLRDWRRSDDRGHDEANLSDMVAATIVFRCGCRLPEFNVRTKRRKSGLPLAAWLAEALIRKHPALGVDGTRALGGLAS